jgi:hypothetical protein
MTLFGEFQKKIKTEFRMHFVNLSNTWIIARATETIKQRAIYVYLPTHEVVKRWKDLAARATNQPIGNDPFSNLSQSNPDK